MSSCPDPTAQDQEGMDADSTLANVLEVALPLIAVAVVLAPVAVAALKGRWLALAGAALAVGSAIIVFGAFGVGEPSQEFQNTTLFWIVEKLLNIAVVGGVGLVLFSAIRPARTGSLWQRTRDL
jgi:hypothetical protein